MKLLAAIFLGLCGILHAGILDPVADYKQENKLEPSDIIYRWTCDINGDGKSDVFLELRKSFKEDRDDRQTPSWRVYLASKDEPGFVRCTGIRFWIWP